MSYAHDNHHEWVERNCGVKCSELGKNVANILGYIGCGIYNAPINVEKVDWANERYIRVNWERGLSNYDGQALTDLVLVCHQKMVRISVSPCNFHLLKLEFWQRHQREGDVSRRLPTMQTMLDRFNHAWGLEGGEVSSEPTTKEKILDWMLKGEVGASSQCIAHVMVYGKSDGSPWTPSDPSDFLRCLKLLKWVPEIRERLDEMIPVSSRWRNLIVHWNQLEELFLSEVPENKWGSCWKAPKTYAMMKELGL